VSKFTSSDSTTGPQGAVLRGPSGSVFYTALVAALLGFGVFFDHTAATTYSGGDMIATQQADLAREPTSPDVRHVAQWAIKSGDPGGRPFVIVDKQRARLFAFDALGRLRASAPVLLGAVRSDSPVVPATPAGRFVTDTGRSALSDAIVWVNGDVALELHALPSPASPGRALQRLASDRIEDKRISDGSLHVAGNFYYQLLAPLWGRASVAYVLPEMQLVQGMFNRPASDRPRFAQSPRTAPPRRPS